MEADTMEKDEQLLTLDRAAIYQIRVPGRLAESWSESFDSMVITVEQEDSGASITTLTGMIADQAALQGLLRRLYNLGLPLLSVNRIDGDPDEGLWRHY
jgi:hypothetical protein